MTRHRLLPALATPLLVLGLAACGGEDDTATDSGSGCSYVESGAAAKEVDLPDPADTPSGQVDATMSTSIGDLGLTLDADAAPCTVGSFVSLAEQGYYDDTSCHRMTVPDGFQVLQCGDPTGTGSGGPGYTYADELTGDETYPAGTLAMANAGPDTNGSQFFIVYGDTQLSPDYTVFGTVDAAGVAAVTKAARAGVDDANGPGDGHPKTPVDISGVTVS